MASNLACEGLLAAVRVLGLIKGLSTGLREVVGPEKLISDLNQITPKKIVF
jgi:hypothetical protein